MLSNQLAWAQQGGNSAPTSGGDPGYDIRGEENPHPSPDSYSYDAEQPAGEDPQLYWSVIGAKTINGQPAASWPEGSLLVHQYHSLQITWQDSIPGGRLALHTKVPVEGQDGATETQERFFLWTILGAAVYDYLYCDPDIQWSTGSIYLTPNFDPNYYNFPRNGLIYDNQGFCRSQVLTLRFKNVWGFNCRQGSYSWRFNYATDQGHVYVETWTSTDNIIPAQFYQQVPPLPFAGTARNGGLRPQAYGSFNSNLFTTGSTGLSTYTNPNSAPPSPYAGERITRVQIQAVGSSCGFLGSCSTLTATTGIIVYGLDAASNITAREILPNNQLGNLIPAGQGLCVGRRYQVSATSDHASSFDWTTDLGNITSSGITATLDLTQVTAANAPFQVQITATPRAQNQSCLSSPLPTAATFYFRETPAPNNLRLDGNPQICSTPAVRTIRVDPVAGATGYNWRVVSGPGNFNGSGVIFNGPSSVSLLFTGSGTVQVEVTAQDDCNRLSAPTSRSFDTADPNAVPAPLSANLLSNYYSYPWSFAPRIKGKLEVSNPQNGISYSFQVIDTELFNQKQPSSPGATVSYYPSDPKTAGWAASYTTLTQVTGGTSADIEILDPRVASVVVRVTAYNGCGNNGVTQTRDYPLTRPFYGYGLHRTAASTTGDTTAAPGSGRVAQNLAVTEASADPAAGPVLYPNPAHDQLQIVAPSPVTHYEHVVILNAQGAVVQEARAAEGVQLLSLKALPTGIYAVRLFDGQKFVTQRVAKD